MREREFCDRGNHGTWGRKVVNVMRMLKSKHQFKNIWVIIRTGVYMKQPGWISEFKLGLWKNKAKKYDLLNLHTLIISTCICVCVCTHYEDFNMIWVFLTKPGYVDTPNHRKTEGLGHQFRSILHAQHTQSRIIHLPKLIHNRNNVEHKVLSTECMPFPS